MASLMTVKTARADACCGLKEAGMVVQSRDEAGITVRRDKDFAPVSDNMRLGLEPVSHRPVDLGRVWACGYTCCIAHRRNLLPVLNENHSQKARGLELPLSKK
jgi:hypothetical protein